MKRLPPSYQKVEASIFPEEFCTRNFMGRVEPLRRHSIDCLFVSCDSDSTRFRLWSPIAAGNCLDRAEKKIQILLRRLAHLTFFFRRSGIPGPTSRKLSHVKIFMNDGPNPLTWYACCSAIHLAEIQRSFKISSWSYCFGLSRTKVITGGKIIKSKPSHRVYDGGIQCWMFP